MAQRTLTPQHSKSCDNVIPFQTKSDAHVHDSAAHLDEQTVADIVGEHRAKQMHDSYRIAVFCALIAFCLLFWRGVWLLVERLF